MFDHITFGVSDFARSVAFYDRAFAPLSLRRLFDDDSSAVTATSYGDHRPWLWLAGGIDNGAPGQRPQYHPGYYGAFVLDPDGHNIEAVFHEPAAG